MAVEDMARMTPAATAAPGALLGGVVIHRHRHAVGLDGLKLARRKAERHGAQHHVLADAKHAGDLVNCGGRCLAGDDDVHAIGVLAHGVGDGATTPLGHVVDGAAGLLDEGAHTRGDLCLCFLIRVGIEDHHDLVRVNRRASGLVLSGNPRAHRRCVTNAPGRGQAGYYTSVYWPISPMCAGFPNGVCQR
jgi:hypothetical protein